MQQAANTPSHSHEVTKQPDRNYDSLISKTWVPCWCSPTTASWVQTQWATKTVPTSDS